MTQAGIGFAALGRLAVTTGPGTFTGQRVGLAFMRGLRIALKKPLSGITTLEAMAAATTAPRAAAIHDAKRDETYLLLWDKSETVLAPEVLPFAEAIEKIRSFGACALAGTGAPAAAAELGREFSAERYPPARCAVGGATGLAAPGAGCARQRRFICARPMRNCPHEARAVRSCDGRCRPAGGAASHCLFPIPGTQPAICDLLAGAGVFAIFHARWFCAGPGCGRRSGNPHPGSGAWRRAGRGWAAACCKPPPRMLHRWARKACFWRWAPTIRRHWHCMRGWALCGWGSARPITPHQARMPG